MPHGDKTRPDVNARQELFGHCLKVFASDSERQKYDNSLDSLRLDEIKKLAETAGTGEARITSKVSDELITQGKKLGLSQDEVTEAIIDVASRRKWALEVPSTPSSSSMIRCGACGELGSQKGKNCSSCGAAFEIACPKCRTVNPSGATMCANVKCRFEVGNMPLGERQLRTAKAFKKEDHNEALRLVGEALAYWPDHPEALALKGELDEVQKRIDAQRKRVESIQELVRDKKFEAAQKLVDELTRQGVNHPELKRWLGPITSELAKAEALVATAKLLESQRRMDDAFDKFGEAIAVCADCKAARDGQALCPPQQPGQLRADAKLTGIELTWASSSTRGTINYHVVRKSGSPPTSPTDGDVLGSTPNPSFIDTGAGTGARYYYAVFAERSGARSHQSANAGPVIRTREVGGLKAQADDQRVTLEWTPPAGVRSIEVWRKEGQEPVGRGDGLRVSGNLSSAIDAGLTNGRPYGYRVIAVFDGPDGQPLATSGETRLVTPMKLPPPVTDLKVLVKRDEFQATWTAPAQGLVRIYRLSQAPAIAVGQVLAASEIDGFGKPLTLAGPNIVKGSVAGQTELHLLPLTVSGSAYVAGRGLSKTWVPDIDGLTAVHQGVHVTAKWKWPPGITSATVVVSDKGPADQPDDPRAVRVRAEQYSPANGVTLPAPSETKLFVTVFACVNRNGTIEHSPGTGPGCRCETVAQRNRTALYELHAKRHLVIGKVREYVLEVKVDGAAELPELLVVSMPDGLPTRPTDGVVLFRTSPTSASPGQPAQFTGIKPPTWKVSRQNTRVFHAHEEDGRWLVLLGSR